MLALDQRHLHLELRGADRRHIATRATADDDQVEALGHLFLSWCGVTVRNPFAGEDLPAEIEALLG